MHYNRAVSVEARFREFSSKLATEMPSLRARVSNIQNFMKYPCTWESSDFDETWSADRGWSKITMEVYLAALATLTGGKTGCQSGKNSFFGKSRFITFGVLLSA